MAKALQIRDVPEDVHAALRERAAAAGVSLSDYALRALTEVASRPPIADVLRQASLRARGVETSVITAAIRAERDRAS